MAHSIAQGRRSGRALKHGGMLMRGGGLDSELFAHASFVLDLDARIPLVLAGSWDEYWGLHRRA
jgi:hypothetical protein